MDQDQVAQELAQRAQDMAEADPSKTAAEWLKWLKTQLVGEHPPFSRFG